MAELKKKMGKRIIEVRMQKGGSQSDLTRACGKDRQPIELLENEEINSTLYSLYVTSKVRGVSLSSIVRFE